MCRNKTNDESIFNKLSGYTLILITFTEKLISMAGGVLYKVTSVHKSQMVHGYKHINIWTWLADGGEWRTCTTNERSPNWC